LISVISRAEYFDHSSFKFIYSGPDIEVKNMPLNVRNVPIHKDDGYALRSNGGAVQRIHYDTAGTFALGYSWYKDHKRLRFNIGVKWIFYPLYCLYDNELRNYTNAPGTEKRGSDAALTFVGIQKRGIIPDIESDYVDPILNFTPEAGVELMLSENGNSSVGLNLSYFEIQAVNGWDRYNSLEINKTYDLGYYMPVSVYVHYKWITAGIVYPVALATTNIGKEAGVETHITGFISLVKLW